MSTVMPKTVASQQTEISEIRSRPCQHCFLCGSRGELLYEALKDKLFSAPGTWSLKRCPKQECGLVWLDPMPLEEDIGKAYRNYYTHSDEPQAPSGPIRSAYRLAKRGYLALRFGYRAGRMPRWQKALGSLMYLAPSRRAKVDAEVFYLPAKEGGRLLDVGCGNGRTLALMAGLGWQVEGLDLDPNAVKAAKGRGLEVYQGTLESHQFDNACFDAIVMSHVIEHVHDPLSLIKECHRVLKPGGNLVVITPNIQSWGHRIYKRSWRGLEPPRHIQLFTAVSLATLSIKAGFSDVRYYSGGLSQSILIVSHLLWRTHTPNISPAISVVLRLWAELLSNLEIICSHRIGWATEDIVQLCCKPSLD